MILGIQAILRKTHILQGFPPQRAGSRSDVIGIMRGRDEILEPGCPAWLFANRAKLLFVDELGEMPADDGRLPELRNCLRKDIQRPWKPKIIAVEQGDALAAGRAHARIAGRTGSAVRLLHDPDSIAQAPQVLLRSVVRSIVHHDNLEVGEALTPNRVKRPRQQVNTVVGGYDDREEHQSTMKIVFCDRISPLTFNHLTLYRENAPPVIEKTHHRRCAPKSSCLLSIN
jgi:hypothetical protein